MEGFVSEIFVSFQGEGMFAGRRHLFLRLGACNLRCVYCDTPESLVRTPRCRVEDVGGAYEVANPLSPLRVFDALKAQAAMEERIHALAVTGGEPLLQAAFLGELLPTLGRGLPVLLETNGTLVDRFEVVKDWVDIVSMDVKLPSNSGERGFWEEHEAFLEAAEGKIVYVKVPVDDATRDDEMARAAELVARAAPEAPFFIQPILSPDVKLRASVGTLDRFYGIACESLSDVRVLPQAHPFLGIR